MNVRCCLLLLLLLLLLLFGEGEDGEPVCVDELPCLNGAVAWKVVEAAPQALPLLEVPVVADEVAVNRLTNLLKSAGCMNVDMLLLSISSRRYLRKVYTFSPTPSMRMFLLADGVVVVVVVGGESRSLVDLYERRRVK